MQFINRSVLVALALATARTIGCPAQSLAQTLEYRP